MISTMTLVVVTSQVCPPPKKSFEQGTSGPRCFMTASTLSSDATNAIFMQTKHERHQLFYIQSSQSDPFYKWGIDFMTFHPPSSNGHKYIVMAVDYFTKWVEAMPTFNNTADTTTCFFFNHVITRFRVPLQLVSDHGKHFENEIFVELSSKLGFSHEFSSPYYPQSNG
jgi:hypothetical protein